MSIQTTAEKSYMDRPSMKEDDHPEHNMPSSDHNGTELDPYYTAKSVNTGPMGPKGGYADPYPNTDDNTFTASGRDEKIIRAKRKLRDGMK